MSQSGRIKVLLTNDDGAHAPGILALRKLLLPVAECIIVAPAEECSACSHAVTLRGKITAEPLEVEGLLAGYKVWGKPADCVKLALCELLEEEPDFVLSGINCGENLGISVFYSGTVAGAREGAIGGIRSIAFSIAAHEAADLNGAAEICLQVFQKFKNHPFPPNSFLNVNIPNIPAKEIRGFRLTRQADSDYLEKFVNVGSTEEGHILYSLSGDMILKTNHDDDDVKAIGDHYVSITPLQFDLTDYDRKKQLEKEWSQI